MGGLASNRGPLHASLCSLQFLYLSVVVIAGSTYSQLLILNNSSMFFDVFALYYKCFKSITVGRSIPSIFIYSASAALLNIRYLSLFFDMESIGM